MPHKQPLRPDRLRTVPPHFSWLDHRLARDRHLERISHEAAALYLFLVTVADSQGLSYYSDAAISERLAMEPPLLAHARNCLRQAGLIAYRKPLYQVLSLSDAGPPPREAGAPTPLKEIFRMLAGGTP